MGVLGGLDFARFAFLLQAAELGRILFIAAIEASFLDLQIAKLFFVGEEGFQVD